MVEALTPPDSSPDFCAVSLIVPTLNEARNVERLIDRCYQALSQVTDRFEVIIVDDDSPDETYNVATALIPRYPGLSVIRRRKPRDLAGSVVDGWAVAKGEWLAVIDGDLQHPPEKLTALIQAAAATGADITVASRHVRGGGVSEWSLLRRIVSWAACLIASFLLPGILNTVRDPMSGFFVIRRRLLASLHLKPRGYKILLEILARADYSTVVEVPYTFEERKEGASKLGPGQALNYLLHVAALSWDTGEFLRVSKYIAVGALGLAVNAGLSWWLLNRAKAPLLASLAIGFEAAVLHNYILNELWTFRDVVSKCRAVEPAAVRAKAFQIISLLGLIANLAVAAALRFGLRAPDSLAVGAGAAVGGLCNFFFNTHVTWSLWYGEDIKMDGSHVQKRRRVSDVLERVYAGRLPSTRLANSLLK
jgi:dolichol-phosphate mannosyltransferase